jgi:5S rRNA maturation endonuclease (ribonuclease M5)
MVDTSNINLLDIIPTKLKRTGKEYHGPCPFCGGTDRFYAKADKTWGCRRCGRSGDAIGFLQEYHGISFVEACEQLGIKLENNRKPNHNRSQSKAPGLHKVPATNIVPARESVPALDNPEWQERCAAFVDWSWRNLHSGEYVGIQENLWFRGFGEFETDIWMLGYNPQNFKLVWGGVEVYLPKGIVIPYLDAYDNIYKVNIRRERGASPKYLQIKGGANWLFNSHKIKPSSIVIMVEGEIDAMSISVAWNHYQIVPVATGATTGARWLRWPALLATAQKVLVAYDSDEPGNAAAKWWIDILPNAQRLIPLDHDVNDMLMKGISIPDWILSALHTPQEQETKQPKQKTMEGFTDERPIHYQEV